MSSRGRTIRSLAVWIVSEWSFCSRMMPGDEAAVGGGDVGQGVFACDGGAGVEDVFEDVVGIGPVRAGQLGADVAAGVEEAVALEAGPVEHEPAPGRVGGGMLVGGQHLLVLRQQRRLLVRGRPDRAPDGFEPLADLWVAQGQELARDRDASGRGGGPSSCATASSRARAQAGRAESVAIASSRSDSDSSG